MLDNFGYFVSSDRFIFKFNQLLAQNFSSKSYHWIGAGWAEPYLVAHPENRLHVSRDTAHIFVLLFTHVPILSTQTTPNVSFLPLKSLCANNIIKNALFYYNYQNQSVPRFLNTLHAW